MCFNISFSLHLIFNLKSKSNCLEQGCLTSKWPPQATISELSGGWTKQDMHLGTVSWCFPTAPCAPCYCCTLHKDAPHCTTLHTSPCCLLCLVTAPCSEVTPTTFHAYTLRHVYLCCCLLCAPLCTMCPVTPNSLLLS